MDTFLYLVAAAGVWWLGMVSAVFIGGLLFLAAAVVIAVLKLVGIIGWSWWWVVLPVWGALGGAVAKMWIVTRDPMWRLRQ